MQGFRTNCFPLNTHLNKRCNLKNFFFYKIVYKLSLISTLKENIYILTFFIIKCTLTQIDLKICHSIYIRISLIKIYIYISIILIKHYKNYLKRSNNFFRNIYNIFVNIKVIKIEQNNLLNSTSIKCKQF